MPLDSLNQWINGQQARTRLAKIERGDGALKPVEDFHLDANDVTFLELVRGESGSAPLSWQELLDEARAALIPWPASSCAYFQEIEFIRLSPAGVVLTDRGIQALYLHEVEVRDPMKTDHHNGE